MISVALYVIAQVLFLINIQYPKTANFDEINYVPSSKAFLDFKEYRNQEHPPLAKELIAVGIALLGDQPSGWRLMSTVFGALTLVGAFWWALALFRNEQMALMAAALTLFNQLLYVQARIAMLDTFLVAFLIWGLAIFSLTIHDKIKRPTTLPLWITSGALFGFAMACKWSAIFALAPTWLLIVFLMRKPYFFWPRVEFRWVILAFVLMPALCYFSTFLPLAFFKVNAVKPWDILTFQSEMYSLQLRVVGPHPYISHWPTWPLMTRPIWYAFDKEGEFIRGVVLLGNPLIMWGGLAAIVFLLIEAYRKKGLTDFVLVFYYGAMYGSWIVFPRHVAFYYYYYPAAMVLGLALAKVLYSPALDKVPQFKYGFLATAAGLFFYFLPILGAFRIAPHEYMKWMWLSSWI
jgi:dolichyl-phosphate-mannose--protein O-mannosyl transferase